MKLEVVTEKLLGVVSGAERATGKHLSLPILSHILLVARRGVFTLRSTNLDLGVEYSIPAKIEKEGEVAVPGTLFSSFAANLGSARSVLLELSGNKLSVSAQGTRAVFSGVSGDDFPTIPKAEGAAFSMDPRTLLAGFKSVHYAGALGNLKPELGSVYLYHDNEGLVFVATDSFRLAEKRLPFKKTAAVFPPVLIPIKNATELIRMLEGEKGEVRLSIGKGQLSLQGSGLFVTSRLVEGAFPDYRQIIPSAYATEAVALREDVQNALKATMLFSDRFHQLHVRLDPKKKLFELSAKSGELGEGAASVSAALEGEALECNFNHRYIADCLHSIPSDSVAFRFSGENKPLLIGGVGDPSFRYLVMPMNR